MRIGLPVGENTVTSCFLKRTVQFSSQMGPIPMRVFVKEGMTYPVVGKSFCSCGMGSVAVAEEDPTWPLAVSTQTCVVVVSGFPCGATGAM